MPKRKIRDNGMYQQCAHVWVLRAMKLNKPEYACPESVDIAIKDFGHWKKFVSWANEYTSDGCGFAG